VEDMEKLFQAGEPGVDVLKVIDARRKYLRARDSYLDALWSVRQARIDVSAAAGEPALSITGPPPPPAPLGRRHPGPAPSGPASGGRGARRAVGGPARREPRPPENARAAV